MTKQVTDMIAHVRAIRAELDAIHAELEAMAAEAVAPVPKDRAAHHRPALSQS